MEFKFRPKCEDELSEFAVINAGHSVCRIRVLKDSKILSYETAFVVNHDAEVFLITSAYLNKDVEEATKFKLFFTDISMLILRRDYTALTLGEGRLVLRISFENIKYKNILKRFGIHLHEDFLNKSNTFYIIHYGYIAERWSYGDAADPSVKKYTKTKLQWKVGDTCLQFRFSGGNGSKGSLLVNEKGSLVGVVHHYELDKMRGYAFILTRKNMATDSRPVTKKSIENIFQNVKRPSQNKFAVSLRNISSKKESSLTSKSSNKIDRASTIQSEATASKSKNSDAILQSQFKNKINEQKQTNSSWSWKKLVLFAFGVYIVFLTVYYIFMHNNRVYKSFI